MTVAVMAAELLLGLLDEGQEDLPARFFAAVPDLLAAPWGLAVGGDLRFPEVEGERGQARRRPPMPSDPSPSPSAALPPGPATPAPA
jgi:hypothetical protein